MRKLSEGFKSLFLFKNKRINRSLEIIVFVVVMVFKLMYFDSAIRGMNSSVLDKIYMLIISTGTVLVLCSWTLLFSRKVRIFLLIILDTICSFIILADLYFFRYYNDFISLPTLEHMFLLKSVKDSIFEIISFKDVIYILDILILSILVFAMVKFNNVKIKERLPYRKKILKFSSVLFAGMLLITIRITALTDSEIYSWAFERYFFVSNMNILNFHAYDIYEYNLNKHKINKPLQDIEKEEIKTWLKQNNESNSTKNRFTRIAENKNLIVIQVEALQHFVINREINGQQITPNINKLIQRSIYFDNYFFQTAQGNTSDAEFVSNTSLFPIQEGAVYFKYPTNQYKSIGNCLKEKGYTTMAFHGYKSGFWNRGVMYPSLGFDKFYSIERLVFDEQMGLGLSDKSMFNQCFDILSKTQQPFYSFIVTLSSHYPFNYFENYNALNVGEFEGTFLGNYLKSINYTDAAIGEFITKLEESGLLDNSILVLYGDHFAIDKEHANELSSFLGFDVTNQIEWIKQQRVPMLIHIPKDKYKFTVNTYGGQVDLFPTLANLFGISKDNLLGVDLLDKDYNVVLFRNGSFIDGNIYYSSLYNKVYNLETGEEQNIEEYQDLIKKVQYKMNISDIIIQKDLMTFLQETHNK